MRFRRHPNPELAAILEELQRIRADVRRLRIDGRDIAHAVTVEQRKRRNRGGTAAA